MSGESDCSCSRTARKKKDKLKGRKQKLKAECLVYVGLLIQPRTICTREVVAGGDAGGGEMSAGGGEYDADDVEDNKE